LSGNPTLYTVTGTGDDATDPGSLRHAILQANADINPDGSLIAFDATVFSSSRTIILGSTLELSGTAGPERVVGPGAGLVTVSGNQAVRVIQVDSGVTATISGLTVSGGKAETGAGIDNSGTLSISRTTISGNAANGGTFPVDNMGLRGGDGSGGGVDNSGTLTI